MFNKLCSMWFFLVVVVFFLHWAFSHSSHGNESHEYAWDPRALARCRCSFPSCAPGSPFLSRSLKYLQYTEPDVNCTWKYSMDDIRKEYSMWGWKFIRHCTNIRGEINDYCVFVCARTIIIQFDRLSRLSECAAALILVHCRVDHRFHHFKTFPIM